MFLTSRVGQYLFRQLASSYGVTLGVILLAIALVDVVEQMRGIGKSVKLPIIDAFGLTLLKMPSLVDETLAFVVLVGTMMAFIRMNRRGELSALRAAGISAWRFTSPAFALAAFLGLFATTILNPAGIYLGSVYEARKAEIKNQGGPGPANDRVWLRQPENAGQTIVTGLPSKEGASLVNAVFFVFDKVGDKPLQFVRRIDANSATLTEQRWTLRNGVENVPGISQTAFSVLTLPTKVDPSTLLGRFSKPDGVSFWSLPGLISGLKNAGFRPQRYEYQLHKMLARPIFFAAMAAVASAFCLRLARGGGLVANGAIAIGCGILVYFFMNLAGAFAIAEAASPSIAGWAPPIGALAAALAALSFREDG